ncbi:MAG: TrkA C-terminal domain-containing protein, partial [Muribaculaceae bacterium]|nr:TrkA C-terminal domain-containing protein [Muribaculaceae bacterium]
SHRFLAPFVNSFAGEWSRVVCASVTLAAMAPFLLALIMPSSNGRMTDKEWAAAKIPVVVMTIFGLVVAIAFITKAVAMYYSARTGAVAAISVVLLVGLVFSKRVRKNMRRIENKFLDNLNERELRRNGKKNAVVHDLHLAFMTVGAACSFVGERLADSALRRRFGVNIVGIQRGTQYIAVPGGQNRIYPGDVLSVIGTDEQIEKLLPEIEREPATPAEHIDPADIKLSQVLLSETSPIINQTPVSSQLHDNYHTTVVAVDRGDEHIDSRPDLVFRPGDILWVVGRPNETAKLK